MDLCASFRRDALPNSAFRNLSVARALLWFCFRSGSASGVVLLLALIAPRNSQRLRDERGGCPKDGRQSPQGGVLPPTLEKSREERGLLSIEWLFRDKCVGNYAVIIIIVTPFAPGGKVIPPATPGCDFRRFGIEAIIRSMEGAVGRWLRLKCISGCASGEGCTRAGGRSASSDYFSAPAAGIGVFWLLAILACTPISSPIRPAIPAASASPQPSLPDPAADGLELVFSGQRVAAGIDLLVSLGSRAPAARSSLRARRHLARELEALGARLEPGFEARGSESVQALVGVLAGDSADPLLLIARYDTLPGERDAGGPHDRAAASGAAFVLELGRILALEPRPYSIWLVFIEAGAVDPPPDARGAIAVRAFDAGDQLFEDSAFPVAAGPASQSIAGGVLARIRLAIFFDDLLGPDLAVARDLRSQRVYRETFWESAFDLGHVGLFPPDAGFRSIPGFRLTREPGEPRPFLILAGDRSLSRGRSRPPVVEVQKAQIHEEIRRLGGVSVEALKRIMGRLARMDAFSRLPTSRFPLPPAAEVAETSAPVAPTPPPSGVAP